LDEQIVLRGLCGLEDGHLGYLKSRMNSGSRLLIYLFSEKKNDGNVEEFFK
jgi:hypothetical protein